MEPAGRRMVMLKIVDTADANLNYRETLGGRPTGLQAPVKGQQKVQRSRLASWMGSRKGAFQNSQACILLGRAIQVYVDFPLNIVEARGTGKAF